MSLEFVLDVLHARKTTRANTRGKVFMDVTPPFIVSTPPECTLHHTIEEAAAACALNHGDVYDAHGLRLSAIGDGLTVSSVEPDELAHLLRRWLSHVEVFGESTASWPLWLLVHTAVKHVGYGG